MALVGHLRLDVDAAQPAAVARVRVVPATDVLLISMCMCIVYMCIYIYIYIYTYYIYIYIYIYTHTVMYIIHEYVYVYAYYVFVRSPDFSSRELVPSPPAIRLSCFPKTCSENKSWSRGRGWAPWFLWSVLKHATEPVSEANDASAACENASLFDVSEALCIVYHLLPQRTKQDL